MHVFGNEPRMWESLWVKVTLAQLRFLLQLSFVRDRSSNSVKYQQQSPFGQKVCSDIVCSQTRAVLRERSSRRPLSYEEQIMSKDKSTSIFSHQMKVPLFGICQIFFGTTSKTNKYVPSSVTTEKPSLIVN